MINNVLTMPANQQKVAHEYGVPPGQGASDVNLKMFIRWRGVSVRSHIAAASIALLEPCPLTESLSFCLNGRPYSTRGPLSIYCPSLEEQRSREKKIDR